MPSVAPSGSPSSSPTLICHDEPDYRSPNNFTCADHNIQGISCIRWRHLGLTLDDLEDLIINCPVSCQIDCGTLTRFDITIEYQISRVPGLLDAATVDDLNEVTRDYLSEFMRIHAKDPQFFVDNVELLSQEKISRLPSRSQNNNNRNLAEDSADRPAKSVNLWITVAVRGFSFSLPLKQTTRGLLAAIDSLDYSSAIQNSGNYYLEDAYAYSAAAREQDGFGYAPENAEDSSSSLRAAIVVVIVVLVCLTAFCASAYVIHRRWRPLPCCRPRTRKIPERDLQSPESQNVASVVGSMFSFDDTATAGTNGLMRYIGSFSRSKESTSPGSSVQHSMSQDGMVEDLVDEELGLLTPQAPQEEGVEEEESGVEEEEPHPLAGIIPPMIVYDNIEEIEEEDEKKEEPKTKRPRCPSLVPSRRVEATSSFRGALGKRQRPSGAHDLANLGGVFSDNNILMDPFTDPYSSWRRLEATRPSPIGIVMDSDDPDDDEISVASTPVRLQESNSELTGTHPDRRRIRSLDSCILESLSDIVVSSDLDYEAAISPIAIPPLLGRTTLTLDSPNARANTALLGSLTHEQGDSPTKLTAVSPDRDDDTGMHWERNQRGAPETPTLRGGSSHSRSRQLAGPASAQEGRNSFWNRSPIAKGVKDAIWSTKRIGTPTRGSAPPTPTRTEPYQKRSFVGAPPSTPTRDVAARRLVPPPSTPTSTRLDLPVVRRGSSFNLGPPSTPPSRPDVPGAWRSSTPTRLEMMGRRQSTPASGRAEQGRSTSPNRIIMQSHSYDSQGNSRGSERSSASFSTARESLAEEVVFEFRAQRIGKLGLVINSTPQTGPMVEQVKDYSTLFGRIHAGDRIVEVDGVETSNMSIKDVTKRLAGKYGIRTATGEVRIKVSRYAFRERDWNDSDERRSVNSNVSGGGSVDSFYSYHRRNHSDPEPSLDRLSLNSGGEQRLSFQSHSGVSKSGEEV